MKTCKRQLTTVEHAGAAAGKAIEFPANTAEITLRAVDAANVPIAFTVQRRTGAGDIGHPFHFVAGEVCTLADLMLTEALTLVVVSAAGSAVEVLYWTE